MVTVSFSASLLTLLLSPRIASFSMTHLCVPHAVQVVQLPHICKYRSAGYFYFTDLGSVCSLSGVKTIWENNQRSTKTISPLPLKACLNGI